MKLLAHESNELMAARRRSVLPPSVSRPLKRVGGRASPIPAHVRVTGIALSTDVQADFHDRFSIFLEKFLMCLSCHG